MDFSSAENITNMKEAVTISLSTCPPCRRLAQLVSENHPEGLQGYTKVNADTEPANEIAQKADKYMREKGIQSVPCTVFFEDGEPVNHMLGGSTFTLEQIEKHIGA